MAQVHTVLVIVKLCTLKKCVLVLEGTIFIEGHDETIDYVLCTLLCHVKQRAMDDLKFLLYLDSLANDDANGGAVCRY